MRTVSTWFKTKDGDFLGARRPQVGNALPQGSDCFHSFKGLLYKLVEDKSPKGYNEQKRYAAQEVPKMKMVRGQ